VAGVKWPLRLFLSLFAAALILVLLMAWMEVSPIDVLQTVGRVPIGIYLAALALHLFTYCMRALRFRFLIPDEVSPGFRRALVISAAHNMASYVLPAKTGEASLVVYLRVQAGVGASRGLAALLVARFLDAAVLCLWLSAACLYLAGVERYRALDWLGTASALLVAASLLFLVLSVRGHLVVRALEFLLRWFRLHHWTWGERFLRRTNEVATALKTAGRGAHLWLAAASSLPLWASIFGFYWMLGREMGMPDWVGYGEATFGSAMAMLFNLLPVNGAAGMGTQELGWVTGFSQFLGVDSEVALSTGLAIHVIQLFNIVAMGMLAHLVMGMMPRLTTDEE
jgi:uncharacterized protein (TIRG00374 family)